jgi:hypothetical protein
MEGSPQAPDEPSSEEAAAPGSGVASTKPEPAENDESDKLASETRTHESPPEPPDVRSQVKKVAPVPPGVYYGTATFKDRDKGCTFTDDDELSVVVDASGNVEWSGYSEAGMRCPGQVVEPTRCRHRGTGTIERAGKRLLLSLAVAGSQGITFTPLDRQIWSCGRVRIVLPNGVSPSGSCVVLGRPDPEASDVAANNFICAQTNPWRSLEHADITATRSELVVPRGARRRLVLKKQNR